MHRVVAMATLVMPMVVALWMTGSRVWWLPWGVVAVAEVEGTMYARLRR